LFVEVQPRSPGPSCTTEDGAVMDLERLLYSVSDSCKLLSIGRTTFYQLAADGKIPLRKIGAKTVVAAADLKRCADQLSRVNLSRA
jgi:excisionase family DNA binding protein